MGDQGDEGSFQFTEIGLDAGGQECQDLVVHLDPFAEGTGPEHGQPRLVFRTGQFHGKSPLETGKEPLLEVLQVHGSPVGGEYQLLTALVQMIEHIEERVLGALSQEVLDVVHQQDVDLHVERHEIHEAVPLHGIHILRLELVTGHIQDHEVRIAFLDGDAGRLDKMRLAEARAAEDEQRIERGLSGREGNVLSGRDAHPVAFSLDQVRKAIDRIQPRVDLHPLDARENEGTRASGRLVGTDGNRLVGRSQAVGGGIDHGFLHLDGADHIMELGA